MIVRRTRSLAIHSTMDLALMSLSCSRGISCHSSQHTRCSQDGKANSAHIFDAIKVVHVPSFVVLSASAPGKTAYAQVAIEAIFAIVTVKELVPASAGSTSAASPGCLHAISTRHLGFGGTTSRDGQLRQIVVVVDANIRVAIQEFVRCVVPAKKV